MRIRIILFLILVFGIILRALLLFAPLENIVCVVPDDAFYYFKVAQNIVAGKGSSFDGINPTNGYHPLWLIFLLPVVKFFNNPIWVVKLSLGLGVLFNFLSAILVFKIISSVVEIKNLSGFGFEKKAQRENNSWLPVLATAFYFFNPRIVANSLNGLETSLSTFLLLVALSRLLTANFCFLATKKSLVFWGFFLGLLFLSRTDTVFYIISFFFLTIFLSFFIDDRRSNPLYYRGIIKKIMVVVMFFLLTVSPWLGWNYFKFGTIFQSSGMAFPFAIKENFLLAGYTKTQVCLESFKRFLTFLIWGIYPLLGIGKYFCLGFLAFSFLIIGVRWQEKEFTKAKKVFFTSLALLAGSLGLIFVHTAVRWYPRHWYFDSVIPLLIILFSVGLVVFEPKEFFLKLVKHFYPKAKADNWFLKLVLVSLVGLLLTISYVKGLDLLSEGDYPHQTEMLRAAYWLKSNLKENERVAVFNAGIIGFFSGKTVVNLDGAINNSAVLAVKRKKLAEYMKTQRIDYYLDYQPFMNNFYRPFWGDINFESYLVPVAEVDELEKDWEKSKLIIFKTNF